MLYNESGKGRELTEKAGTLPAKLGTQEGVSPKHLNLREGSWKSINMVVLGQSSIQGLRHKVGCTSGHLVSQLRLPNATHLQRALKLLPLAFLHPHNNHN